MGGVVVTCQLISRDGQLLGVPNHSPEPLLKQFGLVHDRQQVAQDDGGVEAVAIGRDQQLVRAPYRLRRCGFAFGLGKFFKQVALPCGVGEVTPLFCSGASRSGE